ncbi:UDP-N-acetylmuramoyl-tripeptide--D-alanyl-D-alanine ligase [Cellulomonas bogoriensis]|uniref:UDP-N-acetylmuramoyl-tripeptide--D-alanyl-D-alanine ligase n=1 Tax=Cellulomonas bogoriensis 69B4 = DSM 16987 TaxID=1386082 RepID=A0A0A0BUM6_9CELL|nr:UDP-N-acetylmuramoyl-tripeptide--D-alanyl-D-alanine ligase [Cellulomonas bogoriensis]KGM10834.1 UDP-N-acetylmuramoyl-tripeptide--D-alanyl-D-alanine ligase [Cellulomonas bogoriensis 69B4 = DSM 16987]
MIDLSPAEIAAVTGGRLVGDPADVTGPVVTDSRQVVPGSLFAAIAGEQVDGHAFAAQAVDSGAAVVLGSREVRDEADQVVPMILVEDVTVALGVLAKEVLARLRRAGDLDVVAVTGSVGKTTTKDVLAQLLEADGPTVWPERSFNNEIGLPLTVLRADATTRHLVLEMGASGVGHIAYLTDIAPPDVAVVLKVGSAHLGEFGGIEAVARAKAEIVVGLLPGGTTVLNVDDARVAAMAAVAPGPVLTFGEDRRADVRAVDVSLDDQGRARMTLEHGDASASAHLTLVGAHHVHNALAAVAACRVLGLDLAVLAERLSGARALSPHRMQVTERPDGVTVIDDSYNANPDSVRAALQALAVRGRGRRTVAVLGEMLELGEDSVDAHDRIGRLAVRLDVSRLVVVGDGARAIHTGAVQEGSWGEESRLLPDVDAAAQWLRSELRAGDVVLVKSSHGAGLWRLADLLVAEGQA